MMKMLKMSKMMPKLMMTMMMTKTDSEREMLNESSQPTFLWIKALNLKLKIAWSICSTHNFFAASLGIVT